MRRIFNSFKGALAAVVALAPCACSATATCYYPNGIVATTYQPCNNSDGSAPAACCELSSSACSATGYCYGNAGVMYRGGCTDQTWSSVNCPQRCRNVNSGAFCNINLCPGTEHNTAFTCSGSGSFTIDMCTTNFTIVAGTPFTPSSTANQSTATVTATATPSACALASSQQSCSDPIKIVGLAVGIPFGALAAFLAAVIFWQHRKYTSTSAVAPGPSQAYSVSSHTAATPSLAYGAESQQYPQQYTQPKLDWKLQPKPAPAELNSVTTTPMYELQEG